MDQPMGWGSPTLSGKPPALCIGSVGDCQGVKAYREILWQVKSLGQIFWVSKKTRFSGRVTVKTPAPRSSPHHCSHWLEWLSNESSNCSSWIGNGETSRLDHGMGKRMPKAVVTLARSFSRFQTLKDSQWLSKICTIYRIYIRTLNAPCIPPPTFFNNIWALRKPFPVGQSAWGMEQWWTVGSDALSCCVLGRPYGTKRSMDTILCRASSLQASNLVEIETAYVVRCTAWLAKLLPWRHWAEEITWATVEISQDQFSKEGIHSHHDSKNWQHMYCSINEC